MTHCMNNNGEAHGGTVEKFNVSRTMPRLIDWTADCNNYVYANRFYANRIPRRERGSEAAKCMLPALIWSRGEVPLQPIIMSRLRIELGVTVSFLVKDQRRLLVMIPTGVRRRGRSTYSWCSRRLTCLASSIRRHKGYQNSSQTETAKVRKEKTNSLRQANMCMYVEAFFGYHQGN